MAQLPQSGPMTREQLLALWESVVDPAYAQSLTELGEGEGLETYTQAQAAFARVSEAIDVSTQAMFIQPWSGQSNPSAQGEALAAVTLRIARALRIDEPLIIGAGQVFFEEQTTDWGDEPGASGVTVLTGRRYTLVTDLVFGPGEAGPLDAAARADRPGYGFNNPRPGSISYVAQPGTGFNNIGGSIIPTVFSDLLISEDAADTLIPDHVGQYVRFSNGANAGTVKRIVGYVKPDLAATPPTGGSALLDRILVIEGVVGGAGAPVTGETFVQAVTGASAILLKGMQAATPPRMVFRTNGQSSSGKQINAVNVLTGVQSGATMTPATIANPSVVTAEVGTAHWEILDWVEDMGLAVTNPDQPVGGRIGALDALGKERNVLRAPSEPDSSYMPRVATPADTVSPNAIVRSANRVLSPFGIQACFREAGLRLLPGLYFDGALPGGDDANAYDLDSIHVVPATVVGTEVFEGERVHQIDSTTGQIATGWIATLRLAGTLTLLQFYVTGVHGTFNAADPIVCETSGFVINPLSIAGGLRAEDRHRWIFDYVEMRAFFLLGVPTLNLGEFGFAYDNGPSNAYDCAPFLAFYDGFASGAANLYRQLYHAVDPKKAGGVGFDIEREDVACI